MSVPPTLTQDPEVLAEEKKNRIWHLKLERYKEMAGAVSVILQAFKSEAVSLVSGVGTLVVGWFQVRKYIAHGQHEVSTDASQFAQKSAPSAHGHARERQFSEELMVTSTSPTVEVSFFGDPMTYVPVVTLIVFIWSSLAAWAKRKRKMAEPKREIL